MPHGSPARLLLLGAAATIALTACGGGGGTEASDTADATVTVTAGDLFFAPEALSTESGTIAIELANDGAIVHNVVIEETRTKVAEAAGGESATGTVDLEPGTYTFYCDVAGHRDAGMEGTLEVA